MIGAGRVHQQQGMTCRRGIEHHERAPCFLHNPREGVENGDLFGAGRAQILAQQGLSLGVEVATAIRHDLLDIALRLRLRVDSVDPQTGNLSRERDREMGCGIGRAEVGGMTAFHQAEGDGGGDRGLADAALAHDHDQALSVCRQKVDQPVEGGKVAREPHGRSGRCRGRQLRV